MSTFCLSDILLPYQRKFIEAPQRKKIWVSSRQAGKSFALSFLANYEALKKDNGLVLCISTGSRASEELLKKAALVAEAVKVMSDGQIGYSSTSDTIRFQTGSRIISLPSGNPAALRGWTADATIVDEAAFIENPEEVMEAIVPTLTRNPKSKLILASTPAGCQGAFYDIWSSDDDSWYRQMTTIEDAVNDGLKVSIDELHKLVPDPELFAQEFMCHFSKEYGAMLDPDQLQWYEDLPEGTDGIYFSADIGRKHDRSAIVISRTKKDITYVDDIIMLNKCEYQSQLDIFKTLNEKFHFNGGYIDAGGIGNAVAEFANKQISVKIKPWSFTSANKTPMYERVRDRVFQRKILFSKKFKDLIVKDFRNVQRIVTESGQVKFQAGSNDDGHSDFVSSLTLNLQAIHDMPVNATKPAVYARSTAFGHNAYRVNGSVFR